MTVQSEFPSFYAVCQSNIWSAALPAK